MNFRHNGFVMVVAALFLSLHIGAICQLLFGLQIASETRVSEKNLLCPVVPVFDPLDSELHVSLSDQLAAENLTLRDDPLLLVGMLDRLGLETHVVFAPTSRASNESISAVVAILRAPRGSGRESVLLGARLQHESSATLLLVVSRLLAGAHALASPTAAVSSSPYAVAVRRWLSKDIVFAFTTGTGLRQVRELAAVADAAHPRTVSFRVEGAPPARQFWPDAVALGGVPPVFAALTVEGVAGGSAEAHRMTLMADGAGGRQANMDLVSLLSTAAAWNHVRAGLIPDKTRMGEEGPEPSPLSLLSFIWHAGLSLPRSAASAYSRDALCFDSLAFSVGTPRPWAEPVRVILADSNAPMRQDSTLPDRPSASLAGVHRTAPPSPHFAPAMTAGTVLVDAVRHLSNTDEHLHHSYTQYVLAGATRFLNAGQSETPWLFEIGVTFVMLWVLGWLLPPERARVAPALVECLATHLGRVAMLGCVYWAPMLALSRPDGTPLGGCVGAWARAQTQGCAHPCLALAVAASVVAAATAGCVRYLFRGPLVVALRSFSRTVNQLYLVPISSSFEAPPPSFSTPPRHLTPLAPRARFVVCPPLRFAVSAARASSGHRWASVAVGLLHFTVVFMAYGFINPAFAYSAGVLLVVSPHVLLFICGFVLPPLPSTARLDRLVLVVACAVLTVPPLFVAFWVVAAGPPAGVGMAGALEAMLRASLEWDSGMWGWLLFGAAPMVALCLDAATL